MLIMNKILLLLASVLMSAGVSIGQFTQSNEPVIGDGTTLYVIDSAAVSYENITGTGVTWNYAMYGGYNDDTRTLTVYDASTTPEAASFTPASTALGIENFLLTYNSSTADDRTSHGFIFNEPDFGEIIVKLDTDPALHYEYPMAVGDQLTDVFEGNMDFELGGFPQTLPVDGDHTVTIDGSGTLELANGVTLSDVTRYKIVEQVNVDNAPLVGNLTLDRVQYEYYQLGSSSLPVLIHSSGILQPEGGGDPLFEYSLVLSAEDPVGIANLTAQSIKETMVYPNPASDNLTIKLPQASKGIKIEVLDNLGKVVINDTMDSEVKNLNISDLEQGLYFVQITSGNVTETKKVIVK